MSSTKQPVPARPPPLDGPALRAALLDGLRFYVMAGNARPPNVDDIIENQLAAIRRASHQPPPDARIRPPMQLEPEPAGEPAEDQQTMWWKRD